MAGWIKLYDDLLTDPKILSLSERNQLLWVRLLLLMKSQGRDGILTSPLSGIAFAVHATSKQMGAALTEFQRRNMVEIESVDNTLTVCIVHWQERQGTYSPQQVQPASSSSAERVRRLRERQKQTHVTPDVTQNVTDCSVTCNADVTQNVTLPVTLSPPHTPPLSLEREKSRAEQSRAENVTSPLPSATQASSALPCLLADFVCFSDAEREQIPSAITHIQSQNFSEAEAWEALHELKRRREGGKQKRISSLPKLGVVIANEQRQQRKEKEKQNNFLKNSEKKSEIPENYSKTKSEQTLKEIEQWKQESTVSPEQAKEGLRRGVAMGGGLKGMASFGETVQTMIKDPDARS